jgi:hypothetical protein
VVQVTQDEQGAAAARLPPVDWNSSGAPKKLVEYRHALIYDGQQDGGEISAELGRRRRRSGRRKWRCSARRNFRR